MTLMRRIVEQLTRDRVQFQSYGDQHLAKHPPQIEKADVNLGFVADINRLLLVIANDHAPQIVIPDDLDASLLDAKPGRVIYRDQSAAVRSRSAGPVVVANRKDLEAFVMTLEGRDGDDFTTVTIPIGTLRLLLRH